MKRFIFIIALCLIAAAGFAQTLPTSIYYRDTPTMLWDAIVLDGEGHPLFAEDIVHYDVYIWDAAQGDIRAQPLTALRSMGSVTVPTITFAVPYRVEWQAAIQPWIEKASGGIEMCPIAYSVDQPPVTVVPFAYVPLRLLPPALRNLRDAGTQGQ